jgi:hypothetical protein
LQVQLWPGKHPLDPFEQGTELQQSEFVVHSWP